MSERFIGSSRMETASERREITWLGSWGSAITNPVITLPGLVAWCWEERSWNDRPHSALVSPRCSPRTMRMPLKTRSLNPTEIQKFRLICVFSGVGFCVMIEIYLLLPFNCCFRPVKFLHYVNSCPVSPSQQIIFVTGAEEINIFCHKWQHHFGSILLSRTSTYSPNHQYHIQP